VFSVVMAILFTFSNRFAFFDSQISRLAQSHFAIMAVKVEKTAIPRSQKRPSSTEVSPRSHNSVIP
jgi:hypothetical protein